jgi:hypothetical protein
MHRDHTIQTLIGAAGLAMSLAAGASAQSVQVLFYEDFESAILRDSVHESTGTNFGVYENVWTNIPPAGWTIDNSGVPFLNDPGRGVEEWKGWAFATIDFWNTVAGQSRAGFASVASGTVAIADGDEWDDIGNPEEGGPMQTLMSTPAINVAGNSTATVRFASSWRAEDDQFVLMRVSYNGGEPVEVLRWESDPNSPNFKADNIAENVQVNLNLPGGTNTLSVSFFYSGSDDWWWAVDNVEIAGNVSGMLLFEDFENLPLQDSIDELRGLPDPEVWTDEFDGWVFDDSGIPAEILNSLDEGVEEWEGWAIANGPWWSTVAGDQRRSEFVIRPGALSRGNCLIADPDEWDDRGSSPAAGGAFNASVLTPQISIDGAEAGTASLNFFSSWRPEDFQEVFIAASFDGGPFTDILRWKSVQAGNPTVDPNGAGNQIGYKPDATNEIVSIALNNPPGAQSVQFEIGMVDGDNDWWWALDDIYVAAQSSSVATVAPAPFFISIPTHNTTTTPTLTYGTGLEGVAPDTIVPGASSFDIIVAKDEAFSDIRYTASTTTGPFTFPGGALQSGVYWVKVVANNAAGSRDSINAVRFAVSNACSNADFNADGIFDLNDITAFISSFQAPCNN